MSDNRHRLPFPGWTDDAVRMMPFGPIFTDRRAAILRQRELNRAKRARRKARGKR